MVYSAREHKSIRRHFDNEGAARTWRQDTSKALRDGKLRAIVPRTTVRERASS